MSPRRGSTRPPRRLLAVATERLFSGRTVVIVAHRLDTVRTADEIMVVEAGRGGRARSEGGPGVGSRQPLLAVADGRAETRAVGLSSWKRADHDRRPGSARSASCGN